MCDLAKLSAVDAAKQTRAGAISAAELVEAALERTAALNERLQAFMTIDETGMTAIAVRATQSSFAAGVLWACKSATERTSEVLAVCQLVLLALSASVPPPGGLPIPQSHCCGTI